VHWDLLPSIVVLATLTAACTACCRSRCVHLSISRTIGFRARRLRIFGGLAYSVLVNGRDREEGFGLHRSCVPLPALLLVMVAGAFLATLFGAVVMSRWMAEMPGVTLTVISIARLLVWEPVRVLSAPGGFSLATVRSPRRTTTSSRSWSPTTGWPCC